MPTTTNADTENAVEVYTRFDDDVLGSIKTFDDVLALFAENGLAVEEVSDYGNGFTLLKDKNALVGVPFAIVEFRFEPGAYMDENGEVSEFAIAYVVTKHGEKHVIVDGSSGICRQLRRVLDARRQRGMTRGLRQGLLVKGGLTRSDYEITDEKGRVSPATTFYLSE